MKGYLSKLVDRVNRAPSTGSIQPAKRAWPFLGATDGLNPLGVEDPLTRESDLLPASRPEEMGFPAGIHARDRTGSSDSFHADKSFQERGVSRVEKNDHLDNRLLKNYLVSMKSIGHPSEDIEITRRFRGDDAQSFKHHAEISSKREGIFRKVSRDSEILKPDISVISKPRIPDHPSQAEASVDSLSKDDDEKNLRKANKSSSEIAKPPFLPNSEKAGISKETPTEITEIKRITPRKEKVGSETHPVKSYDNPFEQPMDAPRLVIDYLKVEVIAPSPITARPNTRRRSFQTSMPQPMPVETSSRFKMRFGLGQV